MATGALIISIFHFLKIFKLVSTIYMTFNVGLLPCFHGNYLGIKYKVIYCYGYGDTSTTRYVLVAPEYTWKG